MDKEKLIKQIMAECAKDGEPVTYEEALEMAEMEIKAKTDCKRYEREVKENKPTNRSPKIDAEKIAIIESVAHQLTRFVKPDAKAIEGAENVKITNKQKEITFTVGENEYSLTLTKHRKKK